MAVRVVEAGVQLGSRVVDPAVGFAPVCSSLPSPPEPLHVFSCPPIVIVIPSARQSSSARSMVGRYPLRRDRNASAGSRTSLATSCPLRTRLVSSLSMNSTRRAVADLLIFRLFAASSFSSNCCCVRSADSGWVRTVLEPFVSLRERLAVPFHLSDDAGVVGPGLRGERVLVRVVTDEQPAGF